MYCQVSFAARLQIIARQPGSGFDDLVDFKVLLDFLFVARFLLNKLLDFFLNIHIINTPFFVCSMTKERTMLSEIALNILTMKRGELYVWF
ncbi:hypothetical protein CW306_14470 [Bacillus sp. BA3]|nr:hypothetical protein CW306_14470 [Bacillus sp. BA3]